MNQGMNTELLERIIETIEAEPRRLNMHGWGHTFTQEHLNRRPTLLPPCGTVGCIAGWAIYLDDARVLDDMKHQAQELGWTVLLSTTIGESRGYNADEPVVALEARRLLGISSVEGERLFYTDFWPEQFRQGYFRAIDLPEQRAKVTVARIRHFIKTGGEE